MIEMIERTNVKNCKLTAYTSRAYIYRRSVCSTHLVYTLCATQFVLRIFNATFGVVSTDNLNLDFV